MPICCTNTRWPALILITVIFSTIGCKGFLNPHKVPIQQGNIVTQEMVNLLQPGMTKKQVKFVLGTPLIVNILNNDQWYYIYTLRLGNGQTAKKELAVTFVDNKLTILEGDYKPAVDKAISGKAISDKSVVNDSISSPSSAI